MLEQLQNWPEAAREILTRRLKNHGRIPAQDCALLCELLNLNLGQLMRALLPVAASHSYAPVSNYAVGAVAMGDQISSDGMADLFLGSNIEFQGASLTTAVHAEQSVTTVCRNHGQNITSLALSAAPCGYCRQFLFEFYSSELPIQIAVDKSIALGELLPHGFGPSDLGISSNTTNSAFSANPHLPENLTVTKDLKNLAIQAATASHAPYSGTLAGCAIYCSNGEVYTGSYLESAAFNPSLNPLAAAIAAAAMSYDTIDPMQIKSIVLVTTSGTISLTDPCRELLKGLSISPDFKVVEISCSDLHR